MCCCFIFLYLLVMNDVLGEFCLTICENALFCLLYLFDGNSCKILTFCCGCCDLFSCLRFGRVTCLLLFLSCVHGLLRGKGAAKWNQLNENIHWGKSPTGEAIVSNQLSFFILNYFDCSVWQTFAFYLL